VLQKRGVSVGGILLSQRRIGWRGNVKEVMKLGVA